MSDWKTPDSISGNDGNADRAADSNERSRAARSVNRHAPDAHGADRDARAMLEASGVGMLVVGRDRKIVEVTPAVRTLVSGPVPDDRLLDALSARLSDGYDLTDHIAEGFRRSEPVERETLTTSGRWFLIRTTPLDKERLAVSFLEITSGRLIRTQQALLAAIVASSLDAIIGQDVEGRITTLNAAAERLYGYSHDELAGRDIGVLVADDYRGRFVDALERARRDEPVEPFETVHRGKAGEQINVLVRLSPIRDAAGACIGISMIAHDVTGQRRAELALRHERDTARQYLEIASAIIIAIDRDERVRLINRLGCRMLGLEESEIIGKNWFEEFVPASAREEARAAFRARIAGADEPAGYVERPLITRDGAERLVAWHTAVIRDDAGAVLCLLGSGQDVTERRSAELALRITAEQFRRAIAALPVPTMLHADDGEILGLSRGWTEATGFSRDEVRTFDEWVRRAFGERRHHAGSLVERVYSRGMPSHDGEQVVKIRSGERRIWDMSSAPLGVDPTGRRVAITMAVDVTERRHLERELLAISEQERGRIGRDLHDGPASQLAGIAMLARGLARAARAGNAVTAEQLEEIAELARDGAEQVRSLAHGLAPVAPEPEGLARALDEMAHGTARHSGIRCVYKGVETLPRLQRDTVSQLYWIAREAVANAVKHARARTIEIRLFVTWSQLVLRVKDDGVGIGVGPKSAGGMGIRIMRHRAGAIGARLFLRSLPSGGTSVTCIVPIAEIAPRSA